MKGWMNKPNMNEAWPGEALQGSNTYLSTLFWQQIKELGREKCFLNFLACGYNNTLIELMKMPYCPLIALRRGCYSAHAHTCGRLATSRRAWDGAQKCPHVSVCGEEKLPKFCLRNLSFNNQALCRNKNLFLKNRNLSWVYFLRADKSRHQRFGLLFNS